MEHLDPSDPLYCLNNCPWYVGLFIVASCALGIALALYVLVPRW